MSIVRTTNQLFIMLSLVLGLLACGNKDGAVNLKRPLKPIKHDVNIGFSLEQENGEKTEVIGTLKYNSDEELNHRGVFEDDTLYIKCVELTNCKKLFVVRYKKSDSSKLIIEDTIFLETTDKISPDLQLTYTPSEDQKQSVDLALVERELADFRTYLSNLARK